MPDASSPERRTSDAVAPSATTRGLMVLLGFIPLAHVLAVVAAAAWAPGGLAARAGAALAVLYVLPPLAARTGARLMPLPRGEMELDDPRFLAWWLSAQWQVLFSRVPLLEELLRVVPGAYSLWLRAWGARIGSLVYWSPGVEALDRGLLDIGDRVVFGAGVRMAGHVLLPGPDGSARILIAPVRIGRGALVGAYSVLTPGVDVSDGSVSPPLRLLRSLRPGGERR